jgi:hypothetical protein
MAPLKLDDTWQGVMVFERSAFRKKAPISRRDDVQEFGELVDVLRHKIRRQHVFS